MKLKLETQDAATILVITEGIEPAHLAVLKAGLTKLFQSGKKTVILDCSSLTEAQLQDPSLLRQIAELRPWAAMSEAQLIVTSPIAGLGHVPSRTEALQILNSPQARSQALEAALKEQLKILEVKKAVLEKKLGGPAQDAEWKKLRHRNSQLKRNIAQAEKASQQFLALRKKDPLKLADQEAAQEKLQKVVDSL